MKVPELVTKWKSAKSNYSSQWNQLVASIKGSAIDPLVIDCTLSAEAVVSTAVTLMEGTANPILVKVYEFVLDIS